MKVITATLTLASLFEEKHSLLIRIWHWSTFPVISASLVFVLFASTIFATKSNIAMVQKQVHLKDGVISALQARAVAHEYSDKLWMLHKYFGYVLCFFLLSRILIEVVQSKEEKIIVKIKQALKLSIINVSENEKGHYLLVKGG